PDSMSELLPGYEGTPVALRVRREGKAMTFKMLRAPVRIQTVTAKLLGKTGYISLRSFESLETCGTVRDRVQILTRAGSKSLILDLGGNRGGEKLMALCVAGLFAGEQPVMGTRVMEFEIPSLRDMPSLPPFTKADMVWENGTGSQLTDLPLVILVNALS